MQMRISMTTANVRPNRIREHASNGRWISIRKGSKVNEIDWAYLLPLNRTRTAQLVRKPERQVPVNTVLVLLRVLFAVTAPQAVISKEASSAGYTVHQKWLASILSAIFMVRPTVKMKTKSMIEAQAVDMMVCRSSGQEPRYAWQKTASVVHYRAGHDISLGSTNHHVRGLSLDRLIMYAFCVQCYTSFK